MQNISSINAILNPQQLDFFLERFNLSQSEIKPNFSGWGKLVIEAKDFIFLFPRDPKTSEMLNRELTIYDFFNSLNSKILPTLIEKVHNENINYYDFGVVRKINGVPYSKFIDNVSYQQLHNFLLELTRVMLQWHSLKIGNLPSGIDYFRSKDTTNEITIENWGQKAIDKTTIQIAIKFFWQKFQPFINQDEYSFEEVELKSKMEKYLTELATIDSVLIHGDIHEDQIFVDPRNHATIMGIIDWGSVKIAHPIWDFDFGEWGSEIWQYRQHFAQFRAAMWKTYLNMRNIQNVSEESLHFFYTLHEIMESIRQKDKSEIGFSEKNFDETIKGYLSQLNEF